jgi:hypothetical protein
MRVELVITTAHLLGAFQHASKVDKLVSVIEQLSKKERKKLFRKFTTY